MHKRLTREYSLAILTGTARAPDPLPPDVPFTLLLPRTRRIARVEETHNNLCCAAAAVGAFSRPYVLQTADCIPCAAYEPEGRAAGLAHFGYRDLIAGVPGRFLRALGEGAGNLRSLRFVFGPSICAACYTHETLPRLTKWLFLRYATPYAAFARRGAEGSHTFDFTAACLHEFERAGIQRAQIEIVPQCTHCTLGGSFHYQGKSAPKVTTLIGPHRAVQLLAAQAAEWH